MQKNLIMTILGPDRPGIVEQLAAVVERCGGNWQESSLSHLAGQFAGIVQLSLPAEAEAEFRSNVAELSASDLECVVKGGAEESVDGSVCFSLELIGNDRPGIVHAVTDVFARAGGNVELFESNVTPAPMSGEMLFKAAVRVCFPSDVDVDALDQQLSRIGEELMLDMNLAGEAS